MAPHRYQVLSLPRMHQLVRSKMDLSLKMSHRNLNFVVLSASLVVAGCYHDFDYEYISLADSMEILEYGRTELRNVRDHVDMPVHYKLERDGYSIYALIDTRSHRPTVIFSVEGKSLIDARINGTGIYCYLFINEIRPYEYERYGYPAGSLRFAWDDRASPECERYAIPAENDRIVNISIFNGSGDKVAEEEILFDIVTNGIHREYDSL